jgi:endonuclease/exonuclease/phosphatase family metal-dependent hydrolase
MRRLIRHIFLTANILVALLLLFTYLISEVNPGKFWIPSILGLVYPYILAMNLFFAIFWAALHWQYALISLACILFGFNTFFSYFQLFGRSTKSTEGITVLSYNVRYFYSYLDKGKKDKSILDFIAAEKADIICLQETKLQKEGTLNPVKLKAYFPGILHCQLAHQSQWGGPVTFTKFPILNMGEIRFDGTDNLVIYTDLLIREDTVRVYNCHLQSYGIDVRKYSVIDTLGFEGEKIDEMKKIGSKLKYGYMRRSSQVNKLVDHISKCPYPVILCGDLNDCPISYSYGQISSLLKDSFVESGRGFSSTYRGKLPSYRIDYIFHSKEFKAYNYMKHDVKFSDHLPISTFLIRKK